MDTHCPYCALQCGMTLTPARGPLPVTVAPRDFPTNRGGLCQKGWTSATVLRAPDRLTSPLLRGPDGEPGPRRGTRPSTRSRPGSVGSRPRTAATRSRCSAAAA